MSITFFFLRIVWERKIGKKEGKKEGRKKGRKEERKEGKKEGSKEGTKTRRYPPFFELELFYNETRSVFFFDSCIYLVILLLYICFDVNLPQLPYLILGFFSSCSLLCLALFYLSFRFPWVR